MNDLTGDMFDWLYLNGGNIRKLLDMSTCI
jgi:hypothetical protein